MEKREQRRVFVELYPELCKPVVCPVHGEQFDFAWNINEQGCPECYDAFMESIGDPPAHGVND